MPGENFSTKELATLNDLRRRIANEGEYSEDEVAAAIRLFADKRAEALQAVEKPTKAKKPSKTINLDDLDNL